MARGLQDGLPEGLLRPVVVAVMLFRLVAGVVLSRLAQFACDGHAGMLLKAKPNFSSIWPRASA